MNNPLIFSLLAALFFGSWPLIAKSTHLGAGWMSLLVAIGTCSMALTSINQTVPSSKMLLIGFAAGIVNGLGMLAYAKLIGWQGVDISRAIPLTLAIIPIVTAIGAFIFYGEPVTAKKIIGLALVLPAIYLLNK